MVQMGTWYQQHATVDSLTAALDGAGAAITFAPGRDTRRRVSRSS
jgi:hypothetical protein